MVAVHENIGDEEALEEELKWKVRKVVGKADEYRFEFNTRKLQALEKRLWSWECVKIGPTMCRKYVVIIILSPCLKKNLRRLSCAETVLRENRNQELENLRDEHNKHTYTLHTLIQISE